MVKITKTEGKILVEESQGKMFLFALFEPYLWVVFVFGCLYFIVTLLKGGYAKPLSLKHYLRPAQTSLLGLILFYVHTTNSENEAAHNQAVGDVMNWIVDLQPLIESLFYMCLAMFSLSVLIASFVFFRNKRDTVKDTSS